MTQDRPTSIEEQVYAVGWALDFIDWRSPVATERLKAALEAALETLRCLQFMREVLK